VALLGLRDQHHAQAVDLARVCDGQTITTDFVLMEVGNWLSQTADRPLFLKLLDMLAADPQTTVIPATRDLFEAGCSLFARRMG
jgi:predicted nucleic acid-binding protein